MRQLEHFSLDSGCLPFRIPMSQLNSAVARIGSRGDLPSRERRRRKERKSFKKKRLMLTHNSGPSALTRARPSTLTIAATIDLKSGRPSAVRSATSMLHKILGGGFDRRKRAWAMPVSLRWIANSCLLCFFFLKKKKPETPPEQAVEKARQYNKACCINAHVCE